MAEQDPEGEGTGRRPWLRLIYYLPCLLDSSDIVSLSVSDELIREKDVVLMGCCTASHEGHARAREEREDAPRSAFVSYTLTASVQPSRRVVERYPRFGTMWRREMAS